ncbi:inorganic diphosphatase [Candidatus Ishikawella capsulata]|uniref:Inorganic pyrophosphatase n=1 Tax=Candidatus Ishikawaella capsulata Mpkobe TaxID=476281 RepID=C5WCB9_9ENTR|nr:inorganic diphosphatase [Candidatus Ishikawaella capsulata]BAH82975.1 inorganic pyrophosphatase [Candidatus Ishikawaella capsulata Mpkobe]
MNFDKIPAGLNLPKDIYVIIEIGAHSTPVKYEINKESGHLFVDRFMSTTLCYPCNYGYINNTLSLDGDPVDVLVPTPHPLYSGSVIRCRPVGMLKMTDESGKDVKIVAVPHNKVSETYKYVKNITDLPELLLNQINHFFQHYKDLENNKWTKIDSWADIKSAELEIINSFQRAQENS